MVIDEGEFGGAWTYSISTIDEEGFAGTVYEIKVTHKGERGNVLDTMFVRGFKAVEEARRFVGLLSHELPSGVDFQRLLRIINAPDAKVYGDDTMVLGTWTVGVNSR